MISLATSILIFLYFSLIIYHFYFSNIRIIICFSLCDENIFLLIFNKLGNEFIRSSLRVSLSEIIVKLNRISLSGIRNWFKSLIYIGLRIFFFWRLFLSKYEKYKSSKKCFMLFNNTFFKNLLINMHESNYTYIREIEKNN